MSFIQACCRKPVALVVERRNGGYLVVIRDVQGKIIAHQETSKNLYENLDRLSKLKVGWYFDGECNRCLPKPPRPWNWRRLKL